MEGRPEKPAAWLNSAADRFEGTEQGGKRTHDHRDPPPRQPVHLGDLGLGAGAVRALYAVIEASDNGSGNIFINTEKVDRLLPAPGQSLLRRLIEPRASRIYFVGPLGFSLSPEGGRVIVRRPRKKSCAGCASCTGARPVVSRGRLFCVLAVRVL